MQTCCKAMSHFVFCVIYPIFPRNIIDVSHLHYFPLFMLQVQSDLSPVLLARLFPVGL